MRSLANQKIKGQKAWACVKCNILKPKKAFSFRYICADGTPTYYSICKECKLKEQRTFYWRKRNIDIDYAQYEQMLQEQNYCCAICGKDNKKEMLSVDHNHKIGKVRGLLCKSCNLGLGYFQENQDFLIKATEYIKTGNKLAVVV